MRDKSSTSDSAPSRSDRLDEILAQYFRAAESGESPSREAWLAAHPDLAPDLREFFADHDRIDRLAQPLWDSAHVQRAMIDMPVDVAVEAAPGTVIGPYKLLQQIGEGGMGVMDMAEQATPVRRKGALKIIKPGMDNREVIARVDADRQALALIV